MKEECALCDGKRILTAGVTSSGYGDDFEVCPCQLSPVHPAASKQPEWKVGDRALWATKEGVLDAVGPGWCALRFAGETYPTIVETARLTRPAPRKRTVTVREYQSGYPYLALTEWTDEQRNPERWTPTGRTHTWEEEDSDGDQG